MVLPSTVKSHIQANHIIHSSLTKQIEKEVKSWQFTDDIEKITIPSRVSPIQHLELPTDGYSCNECGACYRVEDTMRKHCKENHGWVNPNGKARRETAQVDSNPRPWTNVKVQRLRKRKPMASWFEVVLPEPEDPGPPVTSWQIMKQELIDIRNKRLHLARLPSGGPLASREASPWLRKTGWLENLNGLTWLELSPLLEKPGNDEGLVIWDTVGQVIDISNEAVQSNAGGTVLFTVCQAIKGVKPDEPLVTYLENNSLEKFKHAWCKIVIFFWHCEKSQKENCPDFIFSRPQLVAWEHFKKLAEGNDEHNSGNDNMTNLQKACLDFCITLLDDKEHYSPFDCAMTVAIGAFGAASEGWQNPQTYTTYLSGWIKLGRMMLVKKVDLQIGNQQLIEYIDGYAFRVDPNKITSKSDLMETMVHKFMVHGTRGPVDYMLELLAYGRKIDMTTTVDGHKFIG